MIQPQASVVPGPRYDQWQPHEIDLVWYDVDDTLVPTGDRGLPSRAFIDLAREAGKFTTQAIMTGRIRSQAAHIIDACEFTGVSIFSNGAERLNGRTGEIKRFGIPPDFAAGLIDYLQYNDISFWVNDLGDNHFWVPGHRRDAMLVSEDAWATIFTTDTMRSVEYEPREPLYVIAHDVSFSALQKIRTHAESYAQLNPDIMVHVAKRKNIPQGSTAYDVFFQNHRATKDAALLDVLEEAGGVSTDNVLVVDDGLNGLEALRLVGTGVAMGNAEPAVKAVATHIAPQLENDGAVAVQRELILGR